MQTFVKHRTLRALAATVLGIAAMLSPYRDANAQTLVNLKGWGGEAVRSYEGYLGEAPTIMESTCIGYPLAIRPPAADCSASGGLKANITLMNGALPPGFTLQKDGRIAGDPTQPGNWLIKLKADPLECGGKQVFGFQQLVDIRVYPRTECVNDQSTERLHLDSSTRKRSNRPD